MSRSKLINIYDYTDYRAYLRAYFTHRRQKHKFFSLRYFARLAGYNSCGLLIDILSGKTNIGPGVIKNLLKALGLNRKETAYFKNLVHFTQAQTTLEKRAYFENLLTAFCAKGHSLELEQYRYFSKWYYPAVRELLSIVDFNNDYNVILRKLKPRITLAQAKNAIRVLLRYGFIQKNRSGFYRPKHKHITSETGIKPVAVAQFQRDMMDRAKEAIDRFPEKDREISSITFSVAKEDLQKMKEQINICTEKLIAIVKKSKGMDMVGQLNYQLFPLSI